MVGPAGEGCWTGRPSACPVSIEHGCGMASERPFGQSLMGHSPCPCPWRTKRTGRTRGGRARTWREDGVGACASSSRAEGRGLMGGWSGAGRTGRRARMRLEKSGDKDARRTRGLGVRDALFSVESSGAPRYARLKMGAAVDAVVLKGVSTLLKSTRRARAGECTGGEQGRDAALDCISTSMMSSHSRSLVQSPRALCTPIDLTQSSYYGCICTA